MRFTSVFCANLCQVSTFNQPLTFTVVSNTFIFFFFLFPYVFNCGEKETLFSAVFISSLPNIQTLLLLTV